MKIAVAGTGYVGLSLATLLSQSHSVTAVDIVPQKVDMINRRESPLRDEYIERYFAEKDLDLIATLDAEKAYSDAEYVIIATPTNYDPKRNFFDTSAVESVISTVKEVNPEAYMVVKSTVPVGFTTSVREKYDTDRILFSPEFLRESKALYHRSHLFLGCSRYRLRRRCQRSDSLHPCNSLQLLRSAVYRHDDRPQPRQV